LKKIRVKSHEQGANIGHKNNPPQSTFFKGGN